MKKYHSKILKLKLFKLNMFSNASPKTLLNIFIATNIV